MSDDQIIKLAKQIINDHKGQSEFYVFDRERLLYFVRQLLA